MHLVQLASCGRGKCCNCDGRSAPEESDCSCASGENMNVSNSYGWIVLNPKQRNSYRWQAEGRAQQINSSCLFSGCCPRFLLRLIGSGVRGSASQSNILRPPTLHIVPYAISVAGYERVLPGESRVEAPLLFLWLRVWRLIVRCEAFPFDRREVVPDQTLQQLFVNSLSVAAVGHD